MSKHLAKSDRPRYSWRFLFVINCLIRTAAVNWFTF